ncbi:MAG: ribbon-helix-helix domain-containing protein [Acidimicrobiia bacterium]
MIRTEVRLGEEQHKSLNQLAAERGVSLAALIREGVDRLLSETRSFKAGR